MTDELAFQFHTRGLRARGVSRVADEPRAILVLLNEIPGDDDLRRMHDFLVHRPAAEAADWKHSARDIALEDAATVADTVALSTEPDDFALDRCYEIAEKIRELIGK
jgi:hypothetical protein